MATKRTTKKTGKKTTTKRSSRRRTKVEVCEATEQQAQEAAPAIAPDLAAAASEFIAANRKPKRRCAGAEPAAGRQRRQYDLAPGATLTRKFKGKEIVVKVLAGGFEYEGETYKSISALARRITGYQISGPVFFGLVAAGEAGR